MNTNKILRQITFEIYKQRPVMPEEMRTNYRIERANGGLLCDLWFLTSGCTHDANGGCVMCNYGKGSGAVNWERICGELERIVRQFPWKFEDFLLTPSGSMLDEREVSRDMRRDLTEILKDVHAKRFIIETRADTISESGISFIREVIPEAEKYIEIGVESSDNWVLKYCLNKNIAYEMFQAAVCKIHEAGMYVTANIGLGFPFMSERASVCNTVRSVRNVLRDGADSVVLFPYHVKRGTLLDVMEKNGMYDCVSFWALAETLACFSEEELSKIQISWYKDYFGEEKSYIRRSPGTCSECERDVLKKLDAYRETQAPDIVSSLVEYPCLCHENWKRKIAGESEQTQIEAVMENYRRLAELYSVDSRMLERELVVMQEEFEKKYEGTGK
mgnify:CR=1 FL=1